MPEHNGWHSWPDWMSKDVPQLYIVCQRIRLFGLLDLAIMLEQQGLTPPEARERFGLSLEEWEPVERAITDGIVEQTRAGAVPPPHIRRWLDSGMDRQ